jgi:hypothetical protein
MADYSWVQVDTFDGTASHGISAALRVSPVSTPGIAVPVASGSSFIWGVCRRKNTADQIVIQRQYLVYRDASQRKASA